MKLFTVNEALEDRGERDGACLQIEGILNFETEDICLNHWPKAERHPTPYESSIWIEADSAVFSANESVLSRWAGKRVVVLGVFNAAPEKPPKFDGEVSGFGHFGLWPGKISARRIDLLKSWAREHATNS